MPEGLVNQLMACYWIENGHELESIEDATNKETEIIEKLKQIKRRKVKFDF